MEEDGPRGSEYADERSRSSRYRSERTRDDEPRGRRKDEKDNERLGRRKTRSSERKTHHKGRRRKERKRSSEDEIEDLHSSDTGERRRRPSSRGTDRRRPRSDAINLFNVVNSTSRPLGDGFHVSVIPYGALRALQSRIVLLPQYNESLPYKLSCDAHLIQNHQNEIELPPPIKRPRLKNAKVVKVDSLAELAELEKEISDPRQVPVMYENVYIYLESARQCSAWIDYLCAPGRSGASHLVYSDEAYQSPTLHVRRLAPLYAGIGKWFHAFNCLAMPLYKPQSHFDQSAILEAVELLQSLSPIIQRIFVSAKAKQTQIEKRKELDSLEIFETHLRGGTKERRNVKEEVEEDKTRYDEVEIEVPERDISLKESPEVKSLKELTARCILTERVCYTATIISEDLAGYLQDLRERLVAQWMVEIMLKLVYSALQDYQAHDSSLKLLYLLRASLFAAGMRKEWKNLYADFDIGLQCDLGWALELC